MDRCTTYLIAQQIGSYITSHVTQGPCIHVSCTDCTWVARYCKCSFQSYVSDRLNSTEGALSEIPWIVVKRATSTGALSTQAAQKQVAKTPLVITECGAV